MRSGIVDSEAKPAKSMMAMQAHAHCGVPSDHWRLAKKGANMLKASSLILLLALAGCAGISQSYTSSPCNTSPGGAECQMERYTRAGM
jgi:hypothetical protein